MCCHGGLPSGAFTCPRVARMAIPDFVLELRKLIGHAPLWLSGITAVVTKPIDGGTAVLLVKRADTGAWTPVTGIIDPGEEPAVAAVREVHEEAGVEARVVSLKRVHVIGPVTYDNGDVSSYLDLVFACEYISGEPHPADGENTAAEWFSLDALPPMSEGMKFRLDAALDPREACQFIS